MIIERPQRPSTTGVTQARGEVWYPHAGPFCKPLSQSEGAEYPSWAMNWRFILLPRYGLRADEGPASSLLSALHGLWQAGASTISLLTDEGDAPVQFVQGSVGSNQLAVIDSVSAFGPKLVTVTDEAWRAVRSPNSSLRLIAERTYEVNELASPARLPNWDTSWGAPSDSYDLTVLDFYSAEPVEGATVTAYVSFSDGTGSSGRTDADGRVTLPLPGTPDSSVERLYVNPRCNFWSYYQARWKPDSYTPSVRLRPIRPADTDPLEALYRGGVVDSFPSFSGRGVRVAVVDSGVDSSVPGVSGGLNVVTGEPDEEWGDNGGTGHGTHVACLISSRGPGWLSVAPEVELRSYRIFGRDNKSLLSNYALVKAGMRAVDDECDLINLSIEAPSDELLCELAIDMEDHGAVVLAAAGNSGKAKLVPPSSCDKIFAVGSYGQLGCFPADSAHQLELGDVLGKAGWAFYARHSNFDGIDFVSPGVGIVSRLPDGSLAAWNGTSMACALATSCAASQLSVEPSLLRLPRNRDRALALKSQLTRVCESMSFPVRYEGFGFLPPVRRP